jgi:hypothetical protein
MSADRNMKKKAIEDALSSAQAKHKRSKTLFSKAMDLSIMCNVDVAVVTKDKSSFNYYFKPKGELESRFSPVLSSLTNCVVQKCDMGIQVDLPINIDIKLCADRVGEEAITSPSPVTRSTGKKKRTK